MESAALLGLVDQLDGNLGQLEDALGPILEDSLNATSKKLPLLDRAKLNITVVYAIESLIFSYLKVNGVDPREHAIFKEIERVKQYFNKIKEAEEQSVVAKPSITLNKQAAARIIQHSLVREEVSPRIASDKKQAGNGSSDLAQREREARERFMLKRRQTTENAGTIQIPKPATADPAPVEAQVSLEPSNLQHDIDMQDGSSAEEGEIDEEESSVQAPEIPQPASITVEAPQKKRKQKHNSDGASKLSADRKAEKKARKKAKKEAKTTGNSEGNAG